MGVLAFLGVGPCLDGLPCLLNCNLADSRLLGGRCLACFGGRASLASAPAAGLHFGDSTSLPPRPVGIAGVVGKAAMAELQPGPRTATGDASSASTASLAGGMSSMGSGSYKGGSSGRSSASATPSTSKASRSTLDFGPSAAKAGGGPGIRASSSVYAAGAAGMGNTTT